MEIDRGHRFHGNFMNCNKKWLNIIFVMRTNVVVAKLICPSLTKCHDRATVSPQWSLLSKDASYGHDLYPRSACSGELMPASITGSRIVARPAHCSITMRMWRAGKCNLWLSVMSPLNYFDVLAVIRNVTVSLWCSTATRPASSESTSSWPPVVMTILYLAVPGTNLCKYKFSQELCRTGSPHVTGPPSQGLAAPW